MKIMLATRIATDGTPRFSASHLGLFCLPKKDARLIWIENKSETSILHSVKTKESLCLLIKKLP